MNVWLQFCTPHLKIPGNIFMSTENEVADMPKKWCVCFFGCFFFFSNFKTSSQIPLSKWNARLLLSAGLRLASELKCMKLFAITRAITSLLLPHALVPGQAALVVHWHLAVAEPWMLPGPSWATWQRGPRDAGQGHGCIANQAGPHAAHGLDVLVLIYSFCSISLIYSLN